MYLREIAKPQPQSEPILGREDDMSKNLAGGYVFNAGDWDQLRRWLIIGTEGGTYYAAERDITMENVRVLEACLKKDSRRVLDMVLEVSDKGLAPKQDQCIYAMARICAFKGDGTGDFPAKQQAKTRAEAWDVLPKIVRTGSMFLQFISYIDTMRGWGRSLRVGASNWYLNQPIRDVAFQVLKYRNRHGWTHRDVLRMAHPDTSERWSDRAEYNGLFHYLTQGSWPTDDLEPVDTVQQFNALQTMDWKDVVKHLGEYPYTPREFLTSEHLKSEAIWAALTPGMPMTALIRNLATLTRRNVLKPLSNLTSEVAGKLQDAKRLKRARIHPLNLLQALGVYNEGSGVRSSGAWTPVTEISNALEGAVNLAFDLQEPTNKRYYVGVDISGSMSGFRPSGMSAITCAQAAACIALAIARTEPRTYVMGFDHRMVPLNILPVSSYGQALAAMAGWAGGMTDCSLPMLDAMNRGLEVDVFVLITDGETYYGNIHPTEALAQYRRQSGINAKMVVMAMNSTGFSIADPNDIRQLDMVGLDGSGMQVLNTFVKA